MLCITKQHFILLNVFEIVYIMQLVITYNFIIRYQCTFSYEYNIRST